MPLRRSVFSDANALRPLKYAFFGCLGVLGAAMLAATTITASRQARLELAASTDPAVVKGMHVGAFRSPVHPPRAPGGPQLLRRGGQAQTERASRTSSLGEVLPADTESTWEASLHTLSAPESCDRVLVFTLPGSDVGISASALQTVGALVAARASHRAFVLSRDVAWPQDCPMRRMGWDCFLANVSDCVEPVQDGAVPHVALSRPRARLGLDDDARTVVALAQAQAPLDWDGAVDTIEHLAERGVQQGDQGTRPLQFFGARWNHLGEIRRVVETVWVLRPWVSSRIASRVAELQAFNTMVEPHIGAVAIHVPSPDDAQSARLDVSAAAFLEAANRVSESLHGVPAQHVFVVSHDPGMVNEVQALVRKGVTVESLVAPHEEPGSTAAIVTMLAHIEVARRAPMLVSTQSSFFGRLVQALRTAHPQTAVDVATHAPLMLL